MKGLSTNSSIIMNISTDIIQSVNNFGQKWTLFEVMFAQWSIDNLTI